MNRANYYSYIDEKLTTLATRIEARGKLNILDLHLHSESFYLHFFNALFTWELENLNSTKPNVEAIDLVDKKNQIVVQVSATATKQKVESALGKDLSSYVTFTFKFISISKDASALRSKTFKNPSKITFAPESDIYDITSVLKVILGLPIEHQKRIFEFIKNELGTEGDPLKIETNLATIVNILAKEDWDQSPPDMQTCPYNVDRKIEFNRLDAAKSIIDTYKIHYGRLDRIYSEFNKRGVNKSTSVLNIIQKDYLARKSTLSDDALFLKIIECVAERIQKSANYVQIPYDELELCVSILVVDAFIRCKIFENPKELTDVAS